MSLGSLLPGSIRPSLAAERWGREILDQRVVLEGPFRGMRHLSRSLGSMLLPKILGTYEKELEPVWMGLRSRSFDRIIDVGAAEGFYAVGAARLWPSSQIITFESDPKGKELIEALAVLNGVSTDRLQCHSTCEFDGLSELLTSGGETLLIMDAEGAEADLLLPMPLPLLEKVILLVEVHDFLSPGIGKQLEARWRDSHQVTEIFSTERTWRDGPKSLPLWRKWLWRNQLRQWMDEGRPGIMSWIFATPRG